MAIPNNHDFLAAACLSRIETFTADEDPSVAVHFLYSEVLTRILGTFLSLCALVDVVIHFTRGLYAISLVCMNDGQTTWDQVQDHFEEMAISSAFVLLGSLIGVLYPALLLTPSPQVQAQIDPHPPGQQEADPVPPDAHIAALPHPMPPDARGGVHSLDDDEIAHPQRPMASSVIVEEAVIDDADHITWHRVAPQVQTVHNPQPNLIRKVHDIVWYSHDMTPSTLSQCLDYFDARLDEVDSGNRTVFYRALHRDVPDQRLIEELIIRGAPYENRERRISFAQLKGVVSSSSHPAARIIPLINRATNGFMLFDQLLQWATPEGPPSNSSALRQTISTLLSDDVRESGRQIQIAFHEAGVICRDVGSIVLDYLFHKPLTPQEAALLTQALEGYVREREALNQS